MTLEEQEQLYRILFEDSDEEPTSAVYEVYDTLAELLENRKLLPQTIRVLH